MPVYFKRFGGNIALALCSTAICLLAIEVLFLFISQAEKIYPGVMYQTEEPSVKLWCYDRHFNSVADWDLRLNHPYAELTYLNNVDQDSTIADLPPEKVPHAVEIALNEFGFRERPVAELKEAARDAHLTLVIGDSFGFGQGVRVEDRFSDILERTLNENVSEKGKHLLINTCVPGFNIAKVSQVLNKYFDRFGAVERVIYAYTLNDPSRSRLTYAMEQSIYDFMHLRENQLLESLPPLLGSLNSRALRFFAARLARQRLSHDTVEWYKMLYEKNAGWMATQKKLDQMATFCRTNSSAMSLIVFPLFHDLEDYPFAEIHRTLALSCRRIDLHHVDLLPVFAGKDERDYWVHPRDFHPNHRAHREAAEFLSTAIPW